MFDLERKRDRDMQRSEAVLHFQREQDMSAEKLPDGYQPHWNERSEQTRPREMFSMGNSYSNLSISANRNGEMTLFTSEKKRHNSETLDGYQKKLNGERSRTVPSPFGRAYTNSHDPINSAFAFKTGKMQPAKRVLAEISKYVDEKGQNTVERALPFLTLQQDKRRLQGLQAQIRQDREMGKDSMELEQEKEQLFRAITQKEHMQSQFMKKMQLAITKAKVITDEGRAEWLNKAVLSGDMGTSDSPPEDEEGIDEGLLQADKNDVQGKKEK